MAIVLEVHTPITELASILINLRRMNCMSLPSYLDLECGDGVVALRMLVVPMRSYISNAWNWELFNFLILN